MIPASSPSELENSQTPGVDAVFDSADSGMVAGIETTADPVVNRADLTRAWEAAGDWLAELVATEVGKAEELARSLAPILFAAGVSLSWGSIYHSTRPVARDRDDELNTVVVC